MTAMRCVEKLAPAPGGPYRGIVWIPGEFPGTGLLTVDTKRARVCYAVQEFPTPVGRGFRLTKVAGGGGTDPAAGNYDLLIANPQDRRCECKGHARHGHCKHLDSVEAVIANGWLDDAHDNPLFRDHVDPAVGPFQ